MSERRGRLPPGLSRPGGSRRPPPGPQPFRAIGGICDASRSSGTVHPARLGSQGHACQFGTVSRAEAAVQCQIDHGAELRISRVDHLDQVDGRDEFHCLLCAGWRSVFFLGRSNIFPYRTGISIRSLSKANLNSTRTRFTKLRTDTGRAGQAPSAQFGKVLRAKVGHESILAQLFDYAFAQSEVIRRTTLGQVPSRHLSAIRVDEQVGQFTDGQAGLVLSFGTLPARTSGHSFA